MCQVFSPLPQLLRNVRFSGANPLDDPRMMEAQRAAEARLSSTGRLLIRPSGTEPLLRVMAEGEDEDLVANVVDTLCDIATTIAAEQRDAA